MNQKLKALSADLWRISYWLATGSDLLAKKFIQRDIGLYSSILLNVGKRDLQKELRKIKSLDGGPLRAAERALTLSVLLSHKI
ncbi:MAG: hypothetical protein UW86_C0003G0006 [Microgenomates group bacterium GW2011_GWA1_Microgenomates_45_10]|nr:MAG: hypothetical protein UW69_C0027G0006 [Microgenomates group bacterium GW2011_GWA2_44_7]KKT77638.1 MAG: hypothetical protein UW73_C0015G0006 [Microgenomates group bacterium GW2011_GWB1_44_8]KKT87361.1 MAG: hypothetical protein UW86_C0003G0006 [Microgenomates group bacterium GW2011_GWA1_Microgenomates_45_10]